MYQPATAQINVPYTNVPFVTGLTAPANQKRGLLDGARDELASAVKDLHGITSQVAGIADAALGCIPEPCEPNGCDAPCSDGTGHQLMRDISYLRESLNALRAQVNRLQTL